MPVVVTGASGMIGRAAVTALAGRSPEVRAVVRRADAAPALRSLGAKVAITRLDDVATVAAVMEGAHTVLHLAGGLDLPDAAAVEEANARTAARAVEAARAARIRRFVLLSFPGADPASPDPYLAAKGRAERIVEDSGLSYAVIRSNHVLGPGGVWTEALARMSRSRPALVVGSGRQLLAPVFVDDVAAVLVAADDRRGLESGTWALDGPRRLTADELADMAAGRHVRWKVHLSPASAARLSRLARRPASPVALAVLAADAAADAPDAAAEFGIVLTPLADALARSLPAAAE
ncbi:MAG TPA: NAD(P)H-binding protein [Actinomycetota bacterium]